jgi:hypothetical protein
MNPPTRSEVIEKLQQLVEDSVSREFVATWAQKWVIADNPPKMSKEIWEALSFLTGADLISLDRPFLYTTKDFENELAKFKSNAPPSGPR